MTTETHTGRLVFGDGQVAVDDGTVLAVPGPSPCATAAGRFAKWGQTQPVNVTGTPDFVDNSPVLYVTKIQWAEQASAATADSSSSGGVQSVADVPVTTKTPAKKKSQKAAASKSTRSRSKK
jgi:hypothetical protein